MSSVVTQEDLEEILGSLENFNEDAYVVEDDRVWVFGTEPTATETIEEMVTYLVHVKDIPCGLPYHDHCGYSFNWYDPGELTDVTVWVEEDYAGSEPGDFKEENPSAEELFDLGGERNE